MRFDSTQYGEIIIDGKKYGDIIVSAGKLIIRDRGPSEEQFGTSHRMHQAEFKQLLEGKPEIVLIGSGQSGLMEVTEEEKKKISETGAELIIEKDPQAIKTFNSLTEQGKKVNCLVHVTC